MTELSPEARALVDAARKSLRPLVTDRARVATALSNKLSRSLPPGAHDITLLPRRAPWLVVGGAFIGISLMIAGGYRALSSEPAQSAPLSLPAPLSAAAPAPSVPLVPPVTAPEVPPAPPPPSEKKLVRNVTSSAKTRPRPTKAHTDFAAEVELLSRATNMLRTGSVSAALKTLDEHQQRFPRGTLRQERDLARAQALCAMGLWKEGRAQLAQLPKGTPGRARADQSCEP